MSEGNFAPIAAATGSRREAGSPLAPTAALTAPPSTPALAVPVAYATWPTQPRHHFGNFVHRRLTAELNLIDVAFIPS